MTAAFYLSYLFDIMIQFLCDQMIICYLLSLKPRREGLRRSFYRGMHPFFPFYYPSVV